MRASIERFRTVCGLSAALFLIVLGGAGCAKSGQPAVSLPALALTVAVAPDNYGTLWVTTAHTAYRSTNGGHAWRAVPGSLPGGSVAFGEHHLYQYAGQAGRVGAFADHGLSLWHRAPVPLLAVTSPYYLTHRVYGLDTSGGLWVSVNMGKAWSPLRASDLPADGVALAARRRDPTKPDTLYVAEGGKGLWKSTDSGATFARVSGVSDAIAVATTEHDDQRVLVADRHGLLISTNDAATFRRALRASDIVAVALDTRNDQNAYATTTGGLLLRSDDGGVSWNR